MRLVTYVGKDKQERIGLQVGELGSGSIIDLRAGFEWLSQQGGTKAPVESTADMLAFIRAQDTTLPAAKRLLQAQSEGKLPGTLIQDETSVSLMAPVPRPLSCRDGYAFRQHVEAARRNRGVEMIPEFDQFPVFYFTNHLAVSGPGTVRVREKAQEKLDFELEAAIVIGREGRDIPASKADDYIFGYTIMNDWSARALQMEEMKLNLGPAKGKDFATTIGPYLVTRDELEKYAVKGENGERHNLRMRAYLNDKQVSDGNMKDMTWTFAQILERVSYGVTVHPGEVIGSGTVGTGCFLELNGSKITDNLWIKPGDRMVLEIEQLGRLENTVVADTGSGK